MQQDYNACYWVPQKREKGETVNFAALYVFPDDLGNIVNAAYWASQPASLQKCNPSVTPDQAKRFAIAMQSGAPFDYLIHVIGWDPWKTTHLRYGYGYTWVPSQIDPPVPVVPGAHEPGLPDYDPDSPATGAIDVAADFQAMLVAYEANKKGV